MEEEMKEKKVSVSVVLLIIALIVIVVMGVFMFKLNKDKKEIEEAYLYASEQIRNLNEKTAKLQGTIDSANEKTTEFYESEKLEIFDMEYSDIEFKTTEIVGAIGGSSTGYIVTTTITKKHDYSSTPENDELYTNDFLGKLFVLYKNKLYYTEKKEIISKYCKSNEVNGSTKLICDYSKINDDVIKEFNIINIDVKIKTIGSYGSAGSGSPLLYAITDDGKVIKFSNDYSSYEIMYDDPEYPIDRIFNMNFHDGIEYTVLLKNGTLFTRNVDREHPVPFYH